jgi:hypothetical protein
MPYQDMDAWSQAMIDGIAKLHRGVRFSSVHMIFAFRNAAK